MVVEYSRYITLSVLSQLDEVNKRTLWQVSGFPSPASYASWGMKAGDWPGRQEECACVVPRGTRQLPRDLGRHNWQAAT